MREIEHQGVWLEGLVEQTRRRLRRNAVLAGVALLELVGVGWLLVAAGVDAAIVLPGWARHVAWAGFWVLLVGVLGALVVWPAVRPMPLQSVAFVIERSLGRMHNRLVSVLDLRRGRVASEGGAGDAFYGRLVAQTAERMAHYEVDAVADPRPARRMMMGAVGLLVVTVLALAVTGERLPTAMKRVLLPGAEIPPVTGVKFAASIDRHVAVLQGEPLRVEAAVTAGSVESLTLRLKAEGEPWASYPMQRSGEGFVWSLDAVDQSYAWQLVGGGTWTRPGRIEMLRRPVVAGVEASVALPKYMNLPEPRPVKAEAAQVSAPKGSVLRIAAAVEGDVAAGQMRLWREETAEANEVVEQRRVWFDDELPADAVTEGRWRWVEDEPFSGSKAHTFDWEGQAYGFETRLAGLAVKGDERFSLAVRLADGARGERPGQVRVGVRERGREGWRWLVWGAEDEGGGERVHVGALPDGAGWHELSVEAGDLRRGKVGTGEAVELTGLRFAVDGGRAWFDRPAAVKRVERSVERTTLEPLRRVAMAWDEQRGRWVGEAPVERDYKVTLRFTNRRGDANVAMQPIPVVATEDQPPTLVVERPGRSVTLAEPATVPIVVRAFDDYGVASVSVRMGPTAERLTGHRRLAEFDEPRPSRVVMGGLSPAGMGLEPGGQRYYQFVVRDRAGQTAVSAPHRLALAEPREAQPAQAVADAGEGQRALLGEIEQLLASQAELAGEVEKLFERLPAGVELGEGRGGEIELVNAEGRPLSEAERRAVYREWAAAMGGEDGQALRALSERLAAQRAEMSTLAGRLNEAAAGANESVTALPIEPEALRAMAEQARRMAEQAEAAAASGEGDAAQAVERLAELSEALPSQQAGLEGMAGQLERLEGARAALENDPAAAQRQIAEAAAEVQARQAAERLAALNEHLQQQAAAMSERALAHGKLAERAADADAQELGRISRQTREELDPETRALMARAERLMAERRAAEAEEATPPAPWVPPGESEEAMPVEQDTPARDADDQAEGETDAAEDAASARERRLAALREMIEALENGEEPAWWDRPVDTPAGAMTREMSERYEDRQRPTEQAEAEEGEAGGAPTPREMLREHHEQMQRALTANSERMRGEADAVGRMMGELQRALSGERGGQMQVSGDQPGAPQPGGESAGQPMAGQPGQPGQAGQPGQPGEAGEQGVAGMLQSPAMQRAMAMAAMAARQQARASGQGSAGQAGSQPPGAVAKPGARSGGNGGAGARPAGPIELGAGGGAAELGDARAQAALYRLPPDVRQPLMQAIREKGPEAYQPFIDAYYRALSREGEGE